MHYFFLDDSAGEFEVLFKRAQFFASRALARLDDPADTQFAKVFELIFKTPLHDTEPMNRSPDFQPAPEQNREAELQPRPVLAHVRRELYSFAYLWARTGNRAQAEVRIHWDGMGRYAKQGASFFDTVNFLVRPYSMKTMKETFGECTATITGLPPVDPRLIPEGENPQRVVIDFTDLARRKQVSWEATAESDLAGLFVNSVADDLLEITLIHEMMHCRAYRLVDFHDENKATSGWKLVAGLTKEQSYTCAESIALLCLAAALAELKPPGQPLGYSYTISGDGTIIHHQDIEDWTFV